MPLPETLPTSSRTDRRRVDIIGIGVQKAASTWLFRCLVEHPGLRSARTRSLDPAAGAAWTAKELNFFNHYHERGYGWYHRMFEFGDWRTMEFSVLYFHDRNVPERVHRYNPDARLLLALRNPIDRAYSHHRHEVRLGRVPPECHEFWRALELNPSYLELGMYASHLNRWLRFFHKDQIHVVDHDEIRAQPDQVIRRALEFIGVDAQFTPASLEVRINDGHASRSHQINRVLRGLSNGARHRLGDATWRALKATRVPGMIRALNRVDRTPTHVPPLTPLDRQRLAEFFARENYELGDLLGRDFSHWR